MRRQSRDPTKQFHRSLPTQVRLDDPFVGLDLSRGSLHQLLALVHDDHAVADRHDHLHVVFDEKACHDSAVKVAFQRGLLVLGCGYKTLQVLPSLDVTEREIRIGADLLVEAIWDVV